MPKVENASSEPLKLMQWGDFKLAMLNDVPYQKMAAATADQRAVSRIENFFTAEIDNWEVAALLWSQMLAGCPEAARPTAVEAGQWSAIATQTNMPIKFTDTGQLVPL